MLPNPQDSQQRSSSRSARVWTPWDYVTIGFGGCSDKVAYLRSPYLGSKRPETEKGTIVLVHGHLVCKNGQRGWGSFYSIWPMRGINTANLA